MTRLWWIPAVALLSTLAAQTAPAQTETATDLSGTWVLDTDVSVDLTKLTFIPPAPAENAGGRTQTRNRRGGGFGGGGFGGGGDRQRETPAKLTNEEQTRLKALAEDLKTGWTKLVISQHDGTVAINDAKDRTYFLKTDGSAADNHVGALTLSSTTRVEDARVVTEWPLGSQITVVYAYAVVTKGRQLVVRVNYRNPDARDVRPFEPSAYLLYKRSGS
jgi:hypothetical protein